MTSAESERAAVVTFLRVAVCNAVAGKDRPIFDVKTPQKAHSVLAFALAKLAEHIEAGDHHIGLVTDDPEHLLSGELNEHAAADHGAGSRSSDGSGSSRDHQKGQSDG